jgi:hypothetical protein
MFGVISLDITAAMRTPTGEVAPSTEGVAKTAKIV